MIRTTARHPAIFTMSAILVCLVLLVITGCAAPNTGIARGNSEVTASFRAFQALSDHRYYIFGGDNRPIAIIGVHNRYTLNSKLWKAFDATGDGLKRKVEALDRYYNVLVTGYDLVDGEGNRVGVWFSHYDYAIRAGFKLGDNNQVVVYPPQDRERYYLVENDALR